MVIIEVGITSQDQLQIIENEKKCKYDVLANELEALHTVTQKKLDTPKNDITSQNISILIRGK